MSETGLIGKRQVVRDLRKIVNAKLLEEGVDYVYTGRAHPEATASAACVYVWKGQPDCLVGHWLIRQGVSPEALEPLWNNSAGAVVREFLGDRLDNEARALLVNVQHRQDGGMPWAEVLEHAELDAEGLV